MRMASSSRRGPAMGRLAARCFVVRHGQGETPYVGLHGWSGSHQSFDPILELLPDSASFFAFDLPGAGRSEAPSSWTVDGVVHELESALDALGVESAHLVAASGGVGFGLPLAARRPDLIARLVLIDPFAYAPWYFRLFTLPVLGRFFYWCTFANPAGRWATNGALARRRTKESNLTEGFRSVNHGANRAQLRAMCDAARVPLSSYIGFRGPVDILQGTGTFASVLTSVKMLTGPLPQARVTSVEGAGHLPMHEATEAVANVVFERHEMPGAEAMHGSAQAQALG